MSLKDGLVLLNKPTDITSFRSLNAIKRAVKPLKVGHAGTLDKFAQGLVVVLVGGFTRLNPFFTGLDKSYLGVVTLGSETATLDPEGEVVDKKPIPEDINWEEVLAPFRGPQQQVPPNYSAVHVQGKRAYQRTLKGETLELPPRDIVIHSLEVVDWTSPHLTIRVSCSKGTYIRSLARDIGRALGSCAHLTYLKRESIGEFLLEKAVDPDSFSPETDILTGRGVFSALKGIEILEVVDFAVPLIANGVPFRRDFTDTAVAEGTWALFNGENFLGVVECLRGRFNYRMIRSSR